MLDAALEHLEVEEATSLNLRKLARDVGVDHRALYRHSRQAGADGAIAEHGWRKLGERMTAAALAKTAVRRRWLPAVSASSSSRAECQPLSSDVGSSLNVSGSFPNLEHTVFDALHILQRGFEDLGHQRDDARALAALFAAALQGVSRRSSTSACVYRPDEQPPRWPTSVGS